MPAGHVVEAETRVVVFWNEAVLLLKGGMTTAKVGRRTASLAGQGALVGQATVIYVAVVAV